MAGSVTPGEDEICIGYLEHPESWRLSSKYFPSKVGGYPAWLALKDLPTQSQLSCRNCNTPMAFLCQLYVPDSQHDYAFHRALFVFACREGPCSAPHFSEGLRVFRCNLPRNNCYYSMQPPLEDRGTAATPSAGDHNKLCHVCGGVGEKVCGQCHRVNYCSRDHQALHWKDGHKRECKQMQQNRGVASSTKNSFLFPEAELVLEPLDDDEESEGEEDELTADEVKEEIGLIKQIHPGIQIDEKAYDAEDDLQPGDGKSRHSKNKKGMYVDRDDFKQLEKVAMMDTDNAFATFFDNMKDDPEQVVRYHRRGTPLYCGERYQPGKGAMMPCPYCHQQRQFEFQILPHLLNHLKVDRLDGPSLDWGVLLIYTCFCDAPVAYSEEQIFKQDYPADR